MPSISYIIATYEGSNHTSNKDYSDIVLHTQMLELFKYLETSTNIIKEVIIVKPPVSPENAYKGYYRFGEWKRKLDNYDVVLKIVPYIGDNKHHSYDQWIQGFQVATGDYFLFLEDDYCINSEYLEADIELMKHYNELFPSKKGYMCQMTDDKYHGFHAAVSNGMISRTTFESMPDPLNHFYSIQANRWPQVNFSHLFFENGIEIKDYREKFGVLFWNSYEENIENHSLNLELSNPLLPVQCILFSDKIEN